MERPFGVILNRSGKVVTWLCDFRSTDLSIVGNILSVSYNGIDCVLEISIPGSNYTASCNTLCWNKKLYKYGLDQVKSH